MRLPFRLACQDLAHDWRGSACFVAAMVGVLAPLLIILALKNGVITTLLGRLVDDPANRELIAIGAGRHDPGFFDRLTARDDVAFAMPATRSINAVANAVRNRDARKLVRKVTLIPSAPGDPLAPDAAVAPGRVLLSAALATELEAAAGDVLELRIERRLGDRPETATRNVEVAAVLPPERYGREALFISLPDLVAVERFRDDPAVTPADWSTPRAGPDAFASFRLYARNLQDVAPLEAWLAGQGIQTRPRAENVALLISFRRSLDLLFAFIAALAIGGFWAAMAANLRGIVERQRVSLSLLNLMGLAETGRRLIPAMQSLMLVFSGVVLALLLVLPTLAVINGILAPEGVERIAWLGPVHLAGTLLLGLVTALTASIWAVAAIGDIGPDEVLTTH